MGAAIPARVKPRRDAQDTFSEQLMLEFQARQANSAYQGMLVGHTTISLHAPSNRPNTGAKEHTPHRCLSATYNRNSRFVASARVEWGNRMVNGFSFLPLVYN